MFCIVINDAQVMESYVRGNRVCVCVCVCVNMKQSVVEVLIYATSPAVSNVLECSLTIAFRTLSILIQAVAFDCKPWTVSEQMTKFTPVSVDSSVRNLFQLLMTQTQKQQSDFISRLHGLLNSKHFILLKTNSRQLGTEHTWQDVCCQSFPASSSIHLYGHYYCVVQETFRLLQGTMSFTLQTNR